MTARTRAPLLVALVLAAAAALAAGLTYFYDMGNAHAQPALVVDAAPSRVDAAAAATPEAATPDASLVPATAPAAPPLTTAGDKTVTAPTTNGEAFSTAKEVYRLWLSGDKKAAVGLVMVLLVFLMRTYLFGWVKWFQTKAGGFTFSMGVGLLTTIGMALAAHVPISFWALLNGVATVAVAAGLWGWLKDHVPGLAKLIDKKTA